MMPPHIVRSENDTPTPGAPLPIINEKTRVGFRLSTWIQIAVAAATALSVGVSFTVWLTVLHSDVAGLIKTVGEIKSDLKELKERKP